MKRILQTLAQKWPEYLLEIMVLVIGIYGAFALDSWNEERKDSQKKRELLQNMKSDFEQDLKRIEELEKILSERSDRAYRILNLINAQPPHIDSIAVLLDLDRVGFLFSFNPAMSTYNEILGSGRLDLIKSDSLKKALADYKHWVENNEKIEDFNAPVLKDYENRIVAHMDAGIGKTGVHDDPPKSYKRVRFDLKSMSEDSMIINNLKAIVNISNEEVKFKSDFLKPRALEVIKLLDRYVEE